MHFTISRETLLTALGRAQGVLEKKSTNPALACVLLSVRVDALTVTATDTLVTMVAKYEATVLAEGEIAVDGQTLFAVVRGFGADLVTVKTVSAGRIRVTCGASVANLNTVGADDFPPSQTPTSNAIAEFTMRGADLARVVDQTAFAVCGDENRYGLNGTHVERIDCGAGTYKVRFAATDGSRLAWSQTSEVLEALPMLVLPRKGLLPLKGVNETRKAIKVADESWKVTTYERVAVFECGDFRLTMRLIEGEFPDYRQVIPDAGSTSHRITMARADLLDALRRISIFATDRNHSVAFSFKADLLLLEATNLDAGDAREEFPINLSGEGFKTGFNAKYFQDILAATHGDLVLEINGTLDPCLVTIKDEPNFLGIVMPMRLD